MSVDAGGTGAKGATEDVCSFVTFLWMASTNVSVVQMYLSKCPNGGGINGLSPNVLVQKGVFHMTLALVQMGVVQLGAVQLGVVQTGVDQLNLTKVLSYFLLFGRLIFFRLINISPY